VTRLVAVAGCLAVVLGGCGGGGEKASTPTTTAAAEPGHADRALEAKLPKRLRGQELVPESFEGEVWVKTAESIGVPIDFRKMLARVGKKPSDMTMAWAKSDAIKVTVIRVTGVDGAALMAAQAKSLRADLHARKQRIAGKDVTTISSGGSGIYLYPSGDLLFTLPYPQANEVKPLVSQLP
jgi:hypothetical protein